MGVAATIKRYNENGGVQTPDNKGKAHYSTANNRGISKGRTSQTVRITPPTAPAVSSGSAVYGYLKTISGLLKLVQLVLGAACVGVVGYYIDHRNSYYTISPKTELFLFVVAVAFLIGTFCLFTSCLVSLPTAKINKQQTIFEMIYHGLASILYLVAGLTLIIEVNYYKDEYRRLYAPFLAASIMGLVMAVLYLLSTIFAWRENKLGQTLLQRRGTAQSGTAAEQSSLS